MQDRIKELAREHLFCDAHGYYGGRSARIESFAQAIARECAEIVDGADTPDGWSNSHISEEIRARFGIAGE